MVRVAEDARKDIREAPKHQCPRCWSCVQVATGMCMKCGALLPVHMLESCPTCRLLERDAE